MSRVVWNALILGAVFALVLWQAGLFAAAVSVVVAGAVSVAFGVRA
jgi:hypothetical protein